MTRKIAVIIGSLRKNSNSSRIAKAIEAEAPKSLTFEHIGIDNLPFYNQDLDPNDAPPQWTAFRDKVRGADAVLFVTPEYNRSMSGVMKNAIDVGSRPYGKSVWAGKPAAVVSSSMGPIGGFGANHHLRQSLHFLDMPALQQPEMYLGSINDNWFGEDGRARSEDSRAFLARFGAAFANWIEATAKA
jgi:chromate reductase